ncbi:MAG: B12-binding domain-containing radical SAM protein [Spirochaetes bacterium]|nr:MAG: B12-binding domain-containing radical SAM protein [Spirochaetota bacterium]
MKRINPTVLLINPPVYDFALYDLFLKPLGLLRVAKWLRDGGYRVEMVNALDYRDPTTESVLGKPKRKENGTGKFFRSIVPKPPVFNGIKRNFARYGILPEVFQQRIRRIRPDLVMVGSGMTYWYPGVSEAVTTAREIYPRVPVVVGGVYATLLPEHCREVTGADYVVQGEAWPALRKILDTLKLPLPPERPDGAPLLLKEIWNDAGVLTLNRGCPLRCSYCATHRLCGGFTEGNPEKAFSLLQRFFSLGIRNYAFYDDALLVNKERVFIPFMEMVVKSDMDLCFYLPNAVHVGYLDRDTASLMKKAGFQEVRLGFESSSDDFHRDLDGKPGRDALAETVEVLRLSGFGLRGIGVYLLAGLPGQRAEEVYESLRFVGSLGINIYISEYSPVPGTALWERSKKESKYPLEEEPLFHNNTVFPMEWNGFTREDLESLKGVRS